MANQAREDSKNIKKERKKELSAPDQYPGTSALVMSVGIQEFGPETAQDPCVSVCHPLFQHVQNF